MGELMMQGLAVIHGRKVYVTGAGQVLDNIHDKSRCAGGPCVVHAPIQGQPWSDWPTLWRSDWGGFMERVCEHGVGHPAAEDVLRWHGGGIDQHGCCGCPCGMTMDVKEKSMENEKPSPLLDAVKAAVKDARDAQVLPGNREHLREAFRKALESPAGKAAQLGMGGQAQKLLDDLTPLALLIKDRQDANGADPVTAYMMAALSEQIKAADSLILAGVVLDLIWKAVSDDS